MRGRAWRRSPPRVRVLAWQSDAVSDAPACAAQGVGGWRRSAERPVYMVEADAQYKFYCPICMLYYLSIYKTKCCEQVRTFSLRYPYQHGPLSNGPLGRGANAGGAFRAGVTALPGAAVQYVCNSCTRDLVAARAAVRTPPIPRPALAPPCIFSIAWAVVQT